MTQEFSDGLRRWPYTKRNVFLCVLFLLKSPELSVLRKVGGCKETRGFYRCLCLRGGHCTLGGSQEGGCLRDEHNCCYLYYYTQCCEWTPNFMCFPFRHASCHLKKCCRQLPSQQNILNMVILRNAGGKSRLSVEGLEVHAHEFLLWGAWESETIFSGFSFILDYKKAGYNEVHKAELEVGQMPSFYGEHPA